MQARVETLLRAARVEDIDSVGQAFDDLLRLLAKAEADGNLTAAANLMRQRLQAHGILRDRVAFTLEEQTSDADLIEQLSGGDAKKATESLHVLQSAHNSFRNNHKVFLGKLVSIHQKHFVVKTSPETIFHRRLSP